MKHDVVVIGGSLAGAACVRELGRLGVDAVALERDRFPRRKVCGGFLSPGAIDCLDRLGMLQDVRNAGAVEVTSARVRSDGVDIAIPFGRPGLGISRAALDTVLAQRARVHQGHMVCDVKRRAGGFNVDGIECRVLIDAAGKQSRFTQRREANEFAIQYTESRPRGSVLDFWLFDDGYGGGVSVEDGQSNFCFLIKKDALRKYLDHKDCLVTGPIAYDRLPGDLIAIGDAAGMVDPFCAEGMRHALETGILAASVVAKGLLRRASYEEMKWEYEAEWDRRWCLRRAAGAFIRRFGGQLRKSPTWIRAIAAISGK